MTIYLEVALQRSTGKFADKQSVYDEVASLVEGQTIYVDDTEYEVAEGSQDEPPPTPRKRLKQPRCPNCRKALAACQCRIAEIIAAATGGGKHEPTAEDHAFMQNKQRLGARA